MAYKYADITRAIIGASMRVHNYFGRGFPEIIYHRALVIELQAEGLVTQSELERVVMYHEIMVGKRRIDLLVEDKVLVELKAIDCMESDCQNQVLNCLKVFGLEVGLLLNFGRTSLEYHRFANSIEIRND